MVAKKISKSDIIGEQGIALVHRVVSGMEFLWHATGGVEAGIDGFIEVRDPGTGVVTSCFLAVQSKATSKEFQAETPDSFEYLCDPDDLEYWLAGNAPVILVRSRPATNEAYWVSIKDYFKDPETRKQRRVVFDKKRDSFDQNCREALIRLAVPRDSGLYLSPLPKTERLYSNLLKVVSFGERLYRAETAFHTPKALWSELQRRGVRAPGDWLLKSGQIISFHDLRQPPWSDICDVTTVPHSGEDANEWAYSGDPVKQREFVQLLNRCLTEKVKPWGLRYHRERRYYYFVAGPKLRTLDVRYKSLTTETSREVFTAHYSKHDPQKLSFCRHSAFEGRFYRYGDTWFLEVTPTYHFTWDGYKMSRFADEFLKKIKMMERNAAVIGQLLMWASYLTRKDLCTPPYPFLELGELQTFELDQGINDKAWLPHEEDSATPQSSNEDLLLFE
jgi:hypothetical protein